MKKLVIAALVATQVTAVAAPARGAEIPGAEPPRSHDMGAFIGARLRLPLDGERRQPRATITAAPALRSVQPDGASRTRIGQGLELGIEGEELRFDLAGRPVSRLVQRGDVPDAERRNISTIGWIAIGVGVAAAAVFTLYVLCGTGEICSTDDD